MVVRIYRATPKLAKVKEYEKLLAEQVLPSLQNARGCRGVKVLKSLGVVREVVIVSYWDTLEAVKAYCGQSWHSPVYLGPETDLIDGQPDVRHYHDIISADF